MMPTTKMNSFVLTHDVKMVKTSHSSVRWIVLGAACTLPLLWRLLRPAWVHRVGNHLQWLRHCWCGKDEDDEDVVFAPRPMTTTAHSGVEQHKQTHTALEDDEWVTDDEEEEENEKASKIDCGAVAARGQTRAGAARELQAFYQTAEHREALRVFMSHLKEGEMGDLEDDDDDAAAAEEEEEEWEEEWEDDNDALYEAALKEEMDRIHDEEGAKDAEFIEYLLRARAAEAMLRYSDEGGEEGEEDELEDLFGLHFPRSTMEVMGEEEEEWEDEEQITSSTKRRAEERIFQ